MDNSGHYMAIVVMIIPPTPKPVPTTPTPQVVSQADLSPNYLARRVLPAAGPVFVAGLEVEVWGRDVMFGGGDCPYV